MFARVIVAPPGGPAERLAEYLTDGELSGAIDAAAVPILIVDDPPPAASAVAGALNARAAFAHLDPERLIVIARRSQLLATLAYLENEASAAVIAGELLRAFDASGRSVMRMPLARRTLDFTDGARVMGILNVTPDSFYDRGRFKHVDRARERAAEMTRQGAAAIDVGGQSYADGIARIDVAEECARVVPVVEALVRDDLGVVLSIDTCRPAVADAALAAGADVINDCSGLADAQLARVVAGHDAGLVVMHLKGELNVRADEYSYGDALAEVAGFLRERTERVVAIGVRRERIMIDPGLEFGKEPCTDLEILNRFADLRGLGFPILLAASRKSFIRRIVGRPYDELLVSSLAAAAVGVLAGAALVRAHDVTETVELCRMLAAVRPQNGRSPRL